MKSGSESVDTRILSLWTTLPSFGKGGVQLVAIISTSYHRFSVMYIFPYAAYDDSASFQFDHSFFVYKLVFVLLYRERDIELSFNNTVIYYPEVITTCYITAPGISGVDN